jgi:hypothetical protein
LHSLKWTDDTTGIDHMTVVRADTRDALWHDVRGVTVLIKALRSRQPQAAEANTSTVTPTPAEAGWCPVHHVQMKQHSNTKGSWWSHKTAGGWCRGQQ